MSDPQSETVRAILEDLSGPYGAGPEDPFGPWDPWGDWQWGWGGGESIFSVGTIEDIIFGGRNPAPARLPPVVISEAQEAIYPGGSGPSTIPPPIHIPEGFETVVIGGEERIRSPRPADAQPPVLDNIDPAILGNPVDDGVLVDDRGEESMADWGDIFSGVVDVIQGQPYGGNQPAAGGFVPGGIGIPPGPGTLITAAGEIDPKTGKLKCKRRRRRRLLTEGDFNDLMRIATLPNNQNVRTALAKGIGRR